MEQAELPTSPELGPYFRKEELKISLPSKGQFYPPGSLEIDENNEVGVLPMTAIDELTLKTPDGLLSGEATWKVMKSCVPSLKNPWMMPSIDVDTILIAIRIASYGETMDVTSLIPVTNTKQTHSINLVELLENRVVKPIHTKITLDNGLEVLVKPTSYKQMANVRKSTFEKQKLATTITDSKISDQDKQMEFNKIFTKLTALNIESLTDNIEAIVTPTGPVSDPAKISEFVNNIDLKHVTAIRKKIEEIHITGSLPPYVVETPDEDIKKGAPKTYKVPVLFDQSDFFATRS
jgi:hypothetical protein